MCVQKYTHFRKWCLLLIKSNQKKCQLNLWIPFISMYVRLSHRFGGHLTAAANANWKVCHMKNMTMTFQKSTHKKALAIQVKVIKSSGIYPRHSCRTITSKIVVGQQAKQKWLNFNEKPRRKKSYVCFMGMAESREHAKFYGLFRFD